MSKINVMQDYCILKLYLLFKKQKLLTQKRNQKLAERNIKFILNTISIVKTNWCHWLHMWNGGKQNIFLPFNGWFRIEIFVNLKIFLTSKQSKCIDIYSKCKYGSYDYEDYVPLLSIYILRGQSANIYWRCGVSSTSVG